jgi:Cu/Ag efflux protein CusF
MEDSMRHFGTLCLASAFIIAATAGAAMAMDKVSGTIKSVDPQIHELTLDDGKTSNVASNVTLDGLKPGDKVTISAETKNGKNMASAVEQTGTARSQASGRGGTPGHRLLLIGDVERPAELLLPVLDVRHAPDDRHHRSGTIEAKFIQPQLLPE